MPHPTKRIVGDERVTAGYRKQCHIGQVSVSQAVHVWALFCSASEATVFVSSRDLLEQGPLHQILVCHRFSLPSCVSVPIVPEI